MQQHFYVIADFRSLGIKNVRCHKTNHKNHPIWQCYQLLVVQLKSEHLGTREFTLISECMLRLYELQSYHTMVLFLGDMKRVNSTLYPRNDSQSHLLLFEMIQNHISSQYSCIFLSGFNCKPYAKNTLVIWILDWVKNASFRSKQNLRKTFPSDL